ncbi:MAG: ABC transporter ATP-binding protein [Pseudomonadota bacterium]
MCSEVVIRAEGLTKTYRVFGQSAHRLLQAVSLGRRQHYQRFTALSDVSFDVRAGEALAIVGRNGSGKSTLLQLVCGIIKPTSGDIHVKGRVSALLELGAGFHPDFTGRENARFMAAVLGLPRADIERRLAEIEAFADIGDFMDQPVRTYSSGMFVRLAFSVATSVEPDILVVDEALAVGDQLFQKRCYDRIRAMTTRGVALLFVSHDQEIARTLTTRAILLDGGRAVMAGPSAEVLSGYRDLLHQAERRYFSGGLSEGPAAPVSPDLRRANPGPPSGDTAVAGSEVRLLEVAVLDESGQLAAVFEPGQPMMVRVSIAMLADLRHLNVSLRIRNKEGVKIYSWGTLNQDIAIWAGRRSGEVMWDREFQSGDKATVDFRCACSLGSNFYAVEVVVSEEADRYYGAQRVLLWQDDAAFFQVAQSRHEYLFGGVCDLQMVSHVRS